MTETGLEIFKPGISSLESLTIPLKSGFTKLVDILEAAENICGYHVYNTRTVGGVFIVGLKVEKIVVWVHGKRLNGYMKNNTKYLMLQDLEDFIYYIGAYYDYKDHDMKYAYDFVYVWDGHLYVSGYKLEPIPLPDNNLFEIENFLMKFVLSIPIHM